MSTDADRPVPFAIPRPGVVKTLGILNVVFSVTMGLCLVTTGIWFLGAIYVRASSGATPAKAEPEKGPAEPPPPAFPMMGMDDPAFLRFSIVDAVTALVLNGVMFATGVGLLNLRPWAARWWWWAAWAKIVRLVLLWGFYVVAVSPTFSENMARGVLAMMKPQMGNAPGRMPSVGDLTRIYSIMNLIMAASMVVLGVIYPAVSLWMLGRPGVRAALTSGPSEEAKLP